MKFIADIDSQIFDLMFAVLEDKEISLLLTDELKELVLMEPGMLARFIAFFAKQFYDDTDVIDSIWEYLERDAKPTAYTKDSIRMLINDMASGAVALQKLGFHLEESEEAAKEALTTFPIEELMLDELMYRPQEYSKITLQSDFLQALVQDYTDNKRHYVERMCILTNSFMRMQVWEFIRRTQAGVTPDCSPDKVMRIYEVVNQIWQVRKGGN